VAESQAHHRRFRSDFPAVPTELNHDLTILADILTDYCGAVETAFVRIAKAFENTVEERRWRKSLLEPMRIEVPA